MDDDPMCVERVPWRASLPWLPPAVIRANVGKRLVCYSCPTLPVVERIARLIPRLDRRHPGAQDYLDVWCDMATED